MSTSRLGLSFWAIVLLVIPACNSIDLPQETPNAPLEKWTGDPSMGDPSLMDAYNDPADLEPDFVRRFDELPLSGTADQIPWTDSYWPKNKGGISYRWQTEQAHTYRSPSRDDVLSMPAEEIATLSPSEKYDLYVGNYEFALTERVKSENSASESDWQGYCHGWTPASYHFAEPSPVVMTNPDGLKIPFGSSDIKALLTYFQGEVVKEQYSTRNLDFGVDPRTIGSQCSNDNPRLPQCYDTNPGAFHIALTNYLGIRRQPFGIDATTTAEKWNQPVYMYTSQVISRVTIEAPVSDARQRVYMRSEVTYTLEIEAAWEKMTGTPGYHKATKTYFYTLDLDGDGAIIGGEWLSRLDDGQFISFGQAVDYLFELDEDQDGKPDLSMEQIKSTIWSYFDFPDYVWAQDAAQFPDTFAMPTSKYAIAFATESSRLALYQYMGKLKTLYEASVDLD